MLPGALLICAFVACTHGFAYWHSHRNTPEGYRKAIFWDPDNPQNYSNLGKILHRSLDDLDLEEIVYLSQKAVELNPQNTNYWVELADVIEWVGQEKEARQAFRRALDHFPNSPYINWKIGNFYLRNGQTRKGLNALQKTLRGDFSLRTQVFDLAWRSVGDSDALFQDLLPENSQFLFPYLNYHAWNHRIDEALEVWAHILTNRIPFAPESTLSFVTTLIRERRVKSLVRVWQDLRTLHPRFIPNWPNDIENLVTNGGFEGKILNAGLGWRVRAMDRVVVSIDTVRFFDGTRALKIRFAGQQNLAFMHIFQYIPVKPGASYKFLGYLQTNNITTDSGPRFEILDALDPKRLHMATNHITGTRRWAPQRLEFQTGPETELLLLRLARPPSSKLDNKISGTVWLDRIILQEIASKP